MLRFLLVLVLLLMGVLAALSQQITVEDILSTEIGQASKTRAALQLRLMQQEQMIVQLQKELGEERAKRAEAESKVLFPSPKKDN